MVNLLRDTDGSPWRRAIPPHHMADLDAFAPDLLGDQRAAILADWASRPVITEEEDTPNA